MAAPVPIATGNLEKTPLPHLLVYLDQRKLSGTLAIWPDTENEQSKQDRILFLKGCPVAGKLIEPAATLREGMLRLFTRARAPYAFYEDNLLGDDRISGRVDPISLITEALRRAGREEVVREVLARVAGVKLRMLPGVDLARYELDPRERGVVELLQAEPATVEDLIAGSGMPEKRAERFVYLLAITKAATPYLEKPAPGEAVEAEPAALPSPPVRAATQAASPPAPPPVTPAAAAKPTRPAPSPPAVPPAPPKAPSMPPPANGARAASTPPPPIAAAPEDEASAGGMHSHLDRLQSIPPPPQGLEPELSQRWLKVVAKGRLVENQNYFEMLELDKDAKSSEARSKFYQLAKDWHPDRLPQELQPLREYVQIIFSYMSEASATLGDEPQRVKYLQNVREGGGTPATERLMQAILDTAMEYERVLVMARKHEYDAAIELMRKILSVVKDDPEYHTMYASLLMAKFPGQGQDAPLAKMLESVDKALELHERHERANMLKGQILRRMGKQAESLEFFRKAAGINPRNIEAMREVRVATMRSDGSAPKPSKGGKGGRGKKSEPPPSGLFGKFFKKS